MPPPPPDVTYRDIPIGSDIQAVRDIVAGTGFFHPPEVEVAAELVEERLAKGTASDYYFWFAERAGKPIAYVCYGPTPCTVGSFDLYWIAVADDWRGRGLGMVLLRMAEKSIAAMGGKRVYIETSGRELYRPTQGFYERAGYVKAAVLADFYDVGDDKIIYQRNLDQRERTHE